MCFSEWVRDFSPHHISELVWIYYKIFIPPVKTYYPMTRVSSLISARTGKALYTSIEEYIRAHPKIISFGFQKKKCIFLSKYLECIENRPDRNRRMRFFTSGITLLQSRNIDSYEKILDKKKCIECTWETADWYLFGLHLREEVESWDKKLYLISTFERNT